MFQLTKPLWAIEESWQEFRSNIHNQFHDLLALFIEVPSGN